ncbi:MAG: FtsX-like permease family protein [Lachnospiraceae bacterium]|nr:FtsX-like permease family protein [Lachnospiraceae bacterium]
MLGIMLQKMWHKKWMNLSLLLGCIMLVATAVSFPLYQSAAYNRMLTDEFDHYLTVNGTWPTQMTLSISTKKEAGGKSIIAMENFIPTICSELGVREKDTIYLYNITGNPIHSEYERNDANELSARLGYKSKLEDHIDIVNGRMYSETGLTEDGAIEVVISQKCMTKQGYLVGETMAYNSLRSFEGDPIRFCIVGVFQPKLAGDLYWNEKESEFDDLCLMNPELFRSSFTGEKAGRFSLVCRYTVMFEYEDILASDVDRLEEKTDYFAHVGKYRNVTDEPPLLEVIESYKNKHSRISATLTILQIPVLIMLAAFLLMISGQMYEMERNEISVIKSRGSSRLQIFRLYLYQGLVLSGAGAAFGIPLGMLLARLLGSTRNFLIFDMSEKLTVSFDGRAAVYVLAAAGTALLCLTIPAIRHSRVSIVNLKQQKAMNKKRLWELLFLDVICIGIAGYGYYSFHRTAQDMTESVLNNKAMDPLLYLSSSLMIVGMGLFFLRLQPLLLKLVFTVGKRLWKPSSFIAFMENVKNGRKQQLIMLFLIMTVSLGMFHSTVARTIVENAVRNKDYIDGCDLLLKEVWTEVIDRNGARTGVFIEPDAGKYLTAPFIDSYTKVYNMNGIEVSGGKEGKTEVSLLGINTKEYGQLTWVDKSLNGKHYYELLNELAVKEDGLLVSSNFRDKLGFKAGDSISYKRENGENAYGVIVDFFDYWPGYASEVSVQQPDGSVDTQSNFLMIGHFEYLRDKIGELPYELVIGLKEGTTEEEIYEWTKAWDLRLTKYVNREADLMEAQTDPLLQGTNGVLTLGFVVTLLLCGVGYLIYWIMALKERELVFGVLRASGFHKRELFSMLALEQFFCGGLSVLAGFGIGKLTSVLFVPILQKVYASSEQLLPLELISDPADLIRLIVVIALVMLVCLSVLTVMLFKMNVAKALKLGEE